MAKDSKFMFFETFLNAIETLPEDKRAEACYKFCRFGLYNELPQDEALKMFCIGVSCSVRKYQGSGGKREGAGRPKKENQNNQKNQINQKNQNEQTETETETEIKKETKNKYGEFNNVKLTDDEYSKLKELYTNKLDEAINILSSYLASKGDKYKSHYAVLGKHNWVYKKIQENYNKKDYVTQMQEMYEYV